MELFKGAKVVRLRSQHLKYLTASDDELSVKQTRVGSSKAARWTVEPVQGKPNLIRLKSYFSSKYLSASEEPFLLGWTGKRVIQSSARLRLDPAVEWEPIKEGENGVKLRTKTGTFLRGNGGVPPWNNSVTVDVPFRNVSQDWVIWTVDVLEIDHELKDEELLESNNEVVGDDSFSRKNEVVNESTTMEESQDFNESEEDLTPMSSNSEHTNSFTKLQSMLSGLHDLLEDTEKAETNTEPHHSEPSSEILHRPHGLEVKMAKQTLKEMKNMDFQTFLSSGREKKLEKSINILISDAKFSSNPQTYNELVTLKNHINSMKNSRELAIQDLSDYETFSSNRIELKAELKKDASKAHELETVEVGFSTMLTTVRVKREGLLKELEEVESKIRAADNAQDIEELISRIMEKSETLREMEKSEETWKEKRIGAEKALESVEVEWGKMKDLLRLV